MQRKSHLNHTLRHTHETSWWKDPPDFLTQEQASLGLMAHAHCTRPGQVQGLGLKPGMMGFYITQGQGSILTARKRGWGKVIFSQACVIPSVHGSHDQGRGSTSRETLHLGGVCIQGLGRDTTGYGQWVVHILLESILVFYFVRPGPSPVVMQCE